MPTISHERAHFDAIKSKHPDWLDIARSQGFWDWLMSQPIAIQRAATEGSAEDVILLIDRYKATVSPKCQEAICTQKL